MIGLNQDLFSTGWFIESTLTELFVTFIIRTRRPFYRSKPSSTLLLFNIAVAIVTIALPYIPIMQTWFHFTPPSPLLILVIVIIVAGYVFSNEIAKRFFYRGTNASGGFDSVKSTPAVTEASSSS